MLWIFLIAFEAASSLYSLSIIFSFNFAAVSLRLVSHQRPKLTALSVWSFLGALQNTQDIWSFYGSCPQYRSSQDHPHSFSPAYRICWKSLEGFDRTFWLRWTHSLPWILFLFLSPGIVRNLFGQSSLVSHLTSQRLESLKERSMRICIE